MWLDIVLIGIGLSMDAFAVATCKGLGMRKINWKKTILIGVYFGGFQALMPLIGYSLGISFASLVSAWDHWIAFVLLGLIGGNMIREALGKQQEDAEMAADFRFRTMLALAIATSIDALACGVTFAFMGWNIWICILVIGLTTAAFSIIGLHLGRLVGSRFRQGASILGGVVLILIGLKILIEHLSGM